MSTVARIGGPVGTFVLTVGVLAVALRLGTSSMPLAVVALVLVGGVFAWAVLGAGRLSTALLVLAFGLVPLSRVTVPGVTAVTLADLAFLGALVLAAGRMLARPVRLPMPFVVGAVVFLVMGVVSLLGSAQVGESAYYFGRAAVVMLAIPALIAWWSPGVPVLRAMAWAYVVGTSVSSLVGLPRGEYRNTGLTDHANALGYTSMLAVCLLPFLVRTARGWGRWAALLPLPVLALGVWSSGSRAALLVILIVAAAVPLLEKSVPVALAVGFGGVALLSSIGRLTDEGSADALSRLFGGSGADGANSEREAGVAEGIALIVERPLVGSGYDVDRIFTVHNVYVQVAAAEGLIGLVGFCLVLYALVVPLRTARHPYRLLAYPALAFVVAGPVSPNLTDRYIAFPLALSLIAAVVGRRTSELEEVASDPPQASSSSSRAASTVGTGMSTSFWTPDMARAGRSGSSGSATRQR